MQQTESSVEDLKKRKILANDSGCKHQETEDFHGILIAGPETKQMLLSAIRHDGAIDPTTIPFRHFEDIQGNRRRKEEVYHLQASERSLFGIFEELKGEIV
jgi:hypothetical protein